MKKKMVVLLALVFLCGCGKGADQTGTQSENSVERTEEAAEEAGIEEEEETESEETEAPEEDTEDEETEASEEDTEDEETEASEEEEMETDGEEAEEKYTSVTVGEIVYKVPDSWSDEMKIFEKSVAYYGDNMGMSVYSDDFDYESIDSMSEMEQIYLKDGLEQGVKDSHSYYEGISSEFIEIAGVKGIEMKANMDLNGVLSYQHSIAFVKNYKNYMFSFVVAQEAESREKYEAEFEEVKNSIALAEEQN